MNKWQDMQNYDGDFALVKFVAPNQLDVTVCGCAINFGGKWKEPYTGKEYLDNNGNPLIPVSWVNLDELEQVLEV